MNHKWNLEKKQPFKIIYKYNFTLQEVDPKSANRICVPLLSKKPFCLSFLYIQNKCDSLLCKKLEHSAYKLESEKI